MVDKDDFLLKEYDSANELTFGIDELRNKISSFCGTFVTVALAGLGLFVKSGSRPAVDQLGWSLPVLLGAVGIIGFYVVKALARLRAAQLEHFRIINNIREHFLRDDVACWNIVELSAKTLPKPNRRSGSYMWAAMVILLSSILLAAGTFVAMFHRLDIWGPLSWVTTAVVVIGSYIVQRDIYLDLAEPRQHERYTEPPTSSSDRTARDAEPRPA